MNHPTLATLIVAGMFALVIINSAPVGHAQSTFPVPPPPTTPIVPVPPPVRSPLPPAFAQPCVNNGTNVLGPNNNGKQIVNQENQCTRNNVTQPNQPPVAIATSPFSGISVSPGTLVTLDGTSSFSPNGGTIVAYSWTQTGPLSVNLIGANTARPAFTAPQVPFTVPLTFTLTVTDSRGAASSPASSPQSTVSITIR